MKQQKDKLIKELKKGYKIEIINAYQPIPVTIRKNGQPFISKYVSDMLNRLQNHNFDFQNDGILKYNELITKYPKCIGGSDGGLTFMVQSMIVI